LRGNITLPVLFGKTVRNWRFWVAENINAPMIIGMSILRGATVNGPERTIQIDSDTRTGVQQGVGNNLLYNGNREGSDTSCL
jgi:hypothetical protein